MAPTKVLNCSHGQALSFEHSQQEQLAEGRALRKFTPSGSLRKKKARSLTKTSFFIPPKYCFSCPVLWEREANISWSMVICKGSTRSELP